MNKTKIEWVKNPDGTQGYTWNPITGCLNGCEYCYARKLANTRLKQRYLANRNIAPFTGIAAKCFMLNWKEAVLKNPFYPRFWPERLYEVGNSWDRRTWHKKIKGVFVCDMSDLFGIGIPEEWTRQVLNALSDTPHRLYLLTKQPQNLPAWSPFPDNCWVGVSATNSEYARRAIIEFHFVEARVKYLSIELLLDSEGYSPWKYLDFSGIKWLIIGAQTKPYRPPKIEWVQEIVQAADKAGIPVFLKNNLRELLIPDALMNDIFWASDKAKLRQEFPDGS